MEGVRQREMKTLLEMAQQWQGFLQALFFFGGIVLAVRKIVDDALEKRIQVSTEQILAAHEKTARESDDAQTAAIAALQKQISESDEKHSSGLNALQIQVTALEKMTATELATVKQQNSGLEGSFHGLDARMAAIEAWQHALKREIGNGQEQPEAKA